MHRQIGAGQVDVKGLADRARSELLLMNVAAGPACRPGRLARTASIMRGGLQV
ncbi:MAG: hypothetical protein U0992_22740 [Planctomycetaceae bacterium]